MTSLQKSLEKRLVKIVTVALVALISGSSIYVSKTSKSTSSSKEIPHVDPQALYEVTKVTDGDTFQAAVGDTKVTVRMLGIDTPETVDPRKTVQCFGKEASNETKGLLSNHSVKLETDPTQGEADKYGRLLAYVHRDDGLFINEHLVAEGYAHEYTYDIPYEKQKDFKDAEKQAREEKKGLWGDVCAGEESKKK